jgi:NitT/TauT family transport system substrate-binding protein
MRLSRLTRTVYTCIAAGVLLAGCGQDSGKTSQTNARIHLNVGVLNAIDCATAHIAKDRGYFAAEGLDVDLTTMPTGLAVLPALQSGSLDVGYGNYVSYFAAQSRGASLHIAADGYQLGPEVQPVIALAGTAIRTPRDLAGKRIAVQLTNNIQTLLINELVRNYGVDPGSLHYITVPFPQMAQALKRGDVDAVSAVEPFTTEMEGTLGAKVVADLDTGATKDTPIGGYVSTESWAKQHGKALTAFRKAMQRAAVDAASRPAVENVLTRYNKIDAQTAALVRIGVFPTSVSTDRLNRITDLMRAAGMLKKPIDLDAMAS